nr:MAG: matrix protein [Vaokses virus]
MDLKFTNEHQLFQVGLMERKLYLNLTFEQNYYHETINIWHGVGTLNSSLTDMSIDDCNLYLPQLILNIEFYTYPIFELLLHVNENLFDQFLPNNSTHEVAQGYRLIKLSHEEIPMEWKTNDIGFFLKRVSANIFEKLRIID